MLKKILLVLILFPLISCGGGWESFESAISGKKKKTTDEYLIKKKDPLILPPDYEKLPLPDTNKTRNQNSNRIEAILTNEETSNQNSKEKSSLEKSIEQELRKN
tara:strand:+ start:77 stop:388 length:312 start_codon:yes stop_codon:yes gene_type:complete